MNRTIFLTGIVLGVLAIILGAFGAHAIENCIDTKAKATFETGVKYQMYHALFLLVLGTMSSISEAKKRWVFYLIVMGILLFSTSIYLLATNSLTGVNFKTIAFLTPIGGFLMIIGWLLFGYRTYKNFS